MTKVQHMTSEILAIVKGNHAMLTLPNGVVDTVEVADNEDIRTQLLRRTVAAARAAGQPVVLRASGDIGDVQLHVAADGTVTVHAQDDEASGEPVGSEIAAEAPLTPADVMLDDQMELVGVPAYELAGSHEADEVFAVSREQVGMGAERGVTTEAVHPAEAAVQPRTDEPLTRRTRRTFIDAQAPVQVQSASLWRRTAAALGIKVSASPKEIAREQDRRVVSVHHGGCRRTAVVNGKGGVGKSMTTAMLAAVYAREGGGGVLAWDNNPTRGSLGWRTESASHDATVQDLLENAGRLLDPTAPRALIAEYVHHQVDDRYDVLRSNPELLAIRQQINADEFDLISTVIDRHYRRVVFDSGNDESASRWLRMIDLSHQLVVPTTGAADSAESGMLLLQELSERDDHSRRLAESAIVVLTHTSRRPSPKAVEIRAGFEDFGATVHEVPFDPALQAVQLRFGQLASETQDAWLRVAAAAAGRV